MCVCVRVYLCVFLPKNWILDHVPGDMHTYHTSWDDPGGG